MYDVERIAVGRDRCNHFRPNAFCVAVSAIQPEPLACLGIKAMLVVACVLPWVCELLED